MFGTKQRNLNLFFVMLTRLRCRLSINCQVQTVSTFTGLNLIVSGTPGLNAAISKGQLVGLENIWKEKLRKNVSREYITPEYVV